MGPDMSEQLEQLTAQIARMDARLAVLTDAVTAMARMQGTRLSRAELAERLGVHPDSITRWLRTAGRTGADFSRWRE
jgi:transposase